MPGTRSSRSENSEGNELAKLPGQRLPDEEAQTQDFRHSDSQASIELKNKNEENDRPNEIGIDESALLWADLKAETGYESYIDYLGDCQEDYPHADLVKKCFLETWRHSSGTHQSCAVFELQVGPSSCPSLDLQSSSRSAAAVFSALRHPSPSGGVRILLWKASVLDQGMLTALGLGLKIHPEFYRVFLVRCFAGGYLPEYREYRTSPWKALMDGFDERGTRPEIFLLDQYLVTIARCYSSADPDAPPVVIIFRLDGPSESKAEKKAKEKSDMMASSEESALKAVSNSIGSLPLWMQEYVRLLKFDLQKSRGGSSSSLDLSCRSLIPLLQFYVSRFREECNLIRTEYLAFTLPQNKFWYQSAFVDPDVRIKGTKMIKGLGDLYEIRFMLRRMIEESEDHSYPNRLRRFTRSQMPYDTTKDEPYIEVEDQLHQAHLEAHRLETEIRDYLQLQTGELALQESRKSIELSSSQIEEAKRVKIFTILAFIYVPLNLATSIFGMNIEQLNGNGQQVWVFILTAVLALTVTGGSWFVLEQTNSYRKWQRRSTEEQYDGYTHFSLAVRLAMITLLFSKGHMLWMLKSGAWWRIIIDHRSRYVGEHDNQKGSLTAGEYVSKYIQTPWWDNGDRLGDAFGSSAFDNIRWKSAPEEDE